MADNFKKKPVYFGDSLIEKSGEVLFSAAQDIKSELGNVGTGLAKSALEQITGVHKPLNGEIDLKANKVSQQTTELQVEQKKHEAQMRQLRYVQQESEKRNTASQKTLESQIQKLLEELQTEVGRLSQKAADLNKEVSSITVQSAPAKAGVYHLNFFDWVIGTIRDIRKKVNESQQWLAMWGQKKKKKGYWANAKKGKQLNLEYVMNDERAVASSNG